MNELWPQAEANVYGACGDAASAHRRGFTIGGLRPCKLCILRFRLKPKTHSRRRSAFSHRNHCVGLRRDP